MKRLFIIFGLLIIFLFPTTIQAKQITNTDATYLYDVMTWKQISALNQYNYVVSYAADINSYLGTSGTINYMVPSDYYYTTAYGYTTPDCQVFLNMDVLRNENVAASGFIFVLAHELRHVWQFKTENLLSEEDADLFATIYMTTLTY